MSIVGRHSDAAPHRTFMGLLSPARSSINLSDGRVADARLLAEMASAARTRPAASANVPLIPVATASAGTVVMSIAPDASANTAPMTDAPVIEPEVARQIEHSGHHPSLVLADVRHDGGVVGGLKQRIPGRDDDERERRTRRCRTPPESWRGRMNRPLPRQVRPWSCARRRSGRRGGRPGCRSARRPPDRRT